MFSDEVDRASAAADIFNADALRDVRRNVLPESHPDFDGKHCVVCGEDIHPVRLAMSRIRCAECQAVIESQKKFFRAR
ncbi:MAG: hypothetical protein N3A02_06850 [Rectinema sp.]|nr:hypothetical protein [Rectinema sp.]